MWNQFTKKGGLKDKEKRAAFLLFCTWANYVIGGVCGAWLAGKSDWSLAPAAAIYFCGSAPRRSRPPPQPPEAAAALQHTGPTHRGPTFAFHFSLSALGTHVSCCALP